MRGSCRCGGVEFEANSVFLFGHCHCSMCRKAHGAAFATYAEIRATQFRFVKGEDLVQLYQSSPQGHRGFCRVCGSNVPVYSRNRKTVWVPAGTLDDDPGMRSTFHMFVGSRAPWMALDDELAKYDESPPE